MKTDQVSLPVDVYNPDQLNLLIIELHNLASKARSKVARSKVHKTTAATDDEPELSVELANLLKANKVADDDVAKLDDLHKAVDAALKAAPVVHVTLAGMASRLLKREITVWFRSRIHPHTLLTFAARSDIGGGIVLSAGSHAYDFSYRQMILANPSRLGELIGV